MGGGIIVRSVIIRFAEAPAEAGLTHTHTFTTPGPAQARLREESHQWEKLIGRPPGEDDSQRFSDSCLVLSSACSCSEKHALNPTLTQTRTHMRHKQTHTQKNAQESIYTCGYTLTNKLYVSRKIHREGCTQRISSALCLLALYRPSLM